MPAGALVPVLSGAAELSRLVLAILTDLAWRRNVALDWDDSPFYQRIAESIGEESYPRYFLVNDPIRRWIHGHRARFGQLRYWSWGKPPPPARHFK